MDGDLSATREQILNAFGVSEGDIAALNAIDGYDVAKARQEVAHAEFLVHIEQTRKRLMDSMKPFPPDVYRKMLVTGFLPGIYRHYKGPLYEAMFLSHDANADDRVVVVYVGLELNDAHEGPRHAVRTIEDFFAQVTLHYPGADVCETGNCDKRLQGYKHEKVPRFRYLGPVYVTGMKDAT